MEKEAVDSGDSHTSLLDTIARYPAMHALLMSRGISGVRKLESTWRKENTLIHASCADGDLVLKILKDERDSELHRLRLMRKTYGCLFPEIVAEEGDAYLMSYIEGNNFFDLPDGDRVASVAQLGQTLSEKWSHGTYQVVDIRDKVRALFARYRASRAQFFAHDEMTEVDLEPFAHVSDRPSHNDLNCANAIYNGSVGLIDPSEEGYNDVARDVGRYTASTFFNYYDRHGQNRTRSLDIAHAFLAPFDDTLLQRAKFYAGESFLSFLRFDTLTVPKTVLKNWAINTLSPGPPLMQCLEACV